MNTGKITEVGAKYIFFWSRKSLEVPKEVGIGFVVYTLLVTNLESVQKGINNCLMVMRLPMIGKT